MSVPSTLDPHSVQPALGESAALNLNRSLAHPRSLVSFLLTVAVAAMTLSALVPLSSVIIMLVWRGGKRLSLDMFTQLPPAAFEEGGGFGNAIVGTLVIVGIAALISVPSGVLAAIFLAEIGPDSRLANWVRFCAKVLSGFPSILAGVFAYGAVVLGRGRSAWEGSRPSRAASRCRF